MKKVKLLFVGVLSLLATSFVSAQYCGGSGPSVCTPGTNLTVQGFSPTYDSLPCAIQGVYYDQTVQVKVPASAVSGGSTYPLNYIQIDTLTNLPCGLCWQSSSSNNRINGGAQGCIRITGTTYDNVGQYTMRVIVTANVKAFGVNVNQPNQDLGTQGLKYFARVQTPAGPCAKVDTLAPGNKATISGTAFTATIAGTPTTFCQGGSVTLTASPAGGSYMWYKGGVVIPAATAVTYVANTSGNYTVQVVKACKASTSAATAVTVNPLPGAAVTPVGPILLCGANTQLLTATPTGATSYAWTNNGASLGVATATYTAIAAGNYRVIVTKGGCTDSSNVVIVNTSTGSALNVNATASSATICPGQSDTLDAGGTYTSYVWSGGGTNKTKVVTSAGIYYLTVTLTSGGCTSTGRDTVVISSGTAVPPITLLPPTIAGCVGTPITLDAGAGYNTYTWSQGLGNARTASATTANTYSVTATKTGTCGSATAASVVSFNALPIINLAVTPSSPSICPDSNQSVILDAGAGYGGYLWTGGTATQTKAVNALGDYKVIVFKTANNCTKTDSVIVTVSKTQAPSIPALVDDSLCQGDSIVLGAGFGYNSYIWNTGATTNFIWAKVAGPYSVTVTNAGDCGSSSVSATVSLKNLPSASFTSAGAILTTSTAGLTYAWFLNGGPILNANSASYTATTTGNYTLKVTSKNGCSAISAPQLITVLGVEDISNEIKFTASPNPVSSFVQLDFNLVKASVATLTITDITGKIINENKLGTLQGKQILNISMEAYSSGLYFVKLQTEMGKAQIRIIKQ